MKGKTKPRPLADQPADQSVAGEEDPGAALDALPTPTDSPPPPLNDGATKATKPEQPVENDPPMQGEGNYTAARRYDKAQEAFVKAGKVDEAAQKAKPKGPREAEELAEAEKAGRAKAKR